MESPENVWPFARPSNDAPTTTSFMVPTQYEDFCGQSDNHQIHGRPETLQSSATLTSSANDKEHTLLHDSAMLPQVSECTNDFADIQAAESFSSVATFRDQPMQVQSETVTQPTTMAGVSTPQSMHEIELHNHSVGHHSALGDEAHTDPSRIISGHTLPGLVSFEPVVAYIDPRSQTIPYNNSTAPTYQNSFYYSCMPPPLLYPPQFSTFCNQPIALGSKNDAYHLQPFPIHQQDSRSKPRQFWAEDDLRRSRFDDRLSGNSLTEFCDDLSHHKNYRNESLGFLNSVKSSSFALDSSLDVARKRHRPNVSQTRDQATHKSRLPFTGAGTSGSGRSFTRGRKVTLASPTPMRIPRESGNAGQAAFLDDETCEASLSLPQRMSPENRSKQDKVELSDLTAADVPPSNASLHLDARALNGYPSECDSTSLPRQQPMGQNQDQKVPVLCLSDAQTTAQSTGPHQSVVKRENGDEDGLGTGEPCMQGHSESIVSSMTLGGVGVIEWQKNCHTNEKDYKTKLIVHDTTNRRDCSPRRSRRVSYHYSDSDLSPVPSASNENDSDDRDDVELRVNESASTKWTDADNARLVRLRASGTTWPALATALGRSKRACQLKYVQLTKQAPYFFLGHPTKVDHLVQLYEDRKDSFWNEIAIELGCSPRVAEEKIFELARERV